MGTGWIETIILLLFLAQSNYLVNECNLSPILLMDEVCSHLDDINRKLLLKITQQFNLQIFMTGTDKKLFDSFGGALDLFEVIDNNGVSQIISA